MMRVTLINHTPNPEEAVIQAAANCWQSVPHEGILDHIIKAGHWTPLEFASFHFEISGVSRVLTHQLVRKRVGVSFCQESQRYVDKSDFDWVTPPSIADRFDTGVYLRAISAAQAAYDELIAIGVSKEDARYFLPQACTSIIHMSINYHALLDLAKERLCSRAQWEIRNLLKDIKTEITKISPKLGGYMQPKCYWLGRCSEKKPCGIKTGKKPKEINEDHSYFVCAECGETVFYSDEKETHRYC